MKGFKPNAKMKVMKKAGGGTVNLGSAQSVPTGGGGVGMEMMRNRGSVRAVPGPGPDPFVGSGNPNVRNPPTLGLDRIPSGGGVIRSRLPAGRPTDGGVIRSVGRGSLRPEDMEGNPKGPGLRLKKGGKANWIQGAIKKPGALKKSLGVAKGEKIPAGKLEKASKAPGKMGKRARLAMTLKGMK